MSDEIRLDTSRPVRPVATASMTEYSTNKASERRYARERIRRRILENAEREAVREGRSVKCGEWFHHAGDKRYDGCKNDGSTCICECHDPGSDAGLPADGEERK